MLTASRSFRVFFESRLPVGSLALPLLALVLSGCTANHVSPAVTTHVAITGRTLGGEQPITGAAIHLYQVGTNGGGSSATDLLSSPAYTSDGTGTGGDASNNFNTLAPGNFTLDGDYQCPATDDLVYLAAVGGNSGAGPNTNIVELVALGHCVNLSTATFVNLNEVTTVGTVAALAPFMGNAGGGSYFGYAGISSTSGDPALESAFNTAAKYINSATGTAPGPALPPGYDASSNDVRALANVLQTCVNSRSTSGNLSSSCTNLATYFNDTEYANQSGEEFSDTVQFAWSVITSPTTDVTAIFYTQSPTPPFLPVNTYASVDWSLPILPIPGTPIFSPTTGAYPSTQIITLSDSDSNAAIYYTLDGSTPTTSSLLYGHTGFYLSSTSTVKAIAVESGRLTSSVGSATYTITPVQAAAPTFSPAGGTYTSPQSVALSDTTPQAVFYYTTDGSTPTAASTRYTGPITVSQNETIKAVATATGYTLSPVSSAAFTITPLYNNTVTTVVGSGESSYYGDGVYATSAQLGAVTGLARDTAGNLYLADNRRIRKITASSGIITTVAGNGNTTNANDGGPATSAGMAPQNLYIASSGRIYFTDTAFHSVRTYNPTNGVVNTVFGGGGNAGSADNNGDGGPATGPTAKAGAPAGVLVDADGNIFFSDSSNNVIRMVYAGGSRGATLLAAENISSPTAGYVYTIAGSPGRTVYGHNNFQGDGAGAYLATLYMPWGMAFDAAGNIVFADFANQHVRRVDVSTGIISTVAGGSTNGAGYVGDGGSAVDPAVRLSAPQAVAYDSNGDLLIADRNNNAVRKVTTATGIITTIAGNGQGNGYSGFTGDGGKAAAATLSSPRSLAIAPSGAFYIADSVNNRVRYVDGSGYISTYAGSGAASYSAGVGGPALQAELNAPEGISVDSSNNFYIVDNAAGSIFAVSSSTGYLTRAPGTADHVPFNNPHGVAVDASGNLYVSNQSTAAISKVTPSGTVSTVVGGGSSGSDSVVFADGVAGTSTVTGVDALHIGSDGNLYFPDYAYGCVRVLNTSAGTVSTVAGHCASNSGSTGFAGDDGPAISSSVKMSSPHDVWRSTTGDLYISDFGNNRVRIVYNGGTAAARLLSVLGKTPTVGYIYTIAGSGNSGSAGDGSLANSASVNINLPYGIVVDPSGNVFFTTYSFDTTGAPTTDDRVRRIDGTTGIITTYVNSTGMRGYNGDGLSASSTQLYRPQGLALDTNGNLLVVDMLNHRIRKVSR